MDLYQSFENAMKAGKNVDTGFILLGILLLIIGTFTFSITTEDKVVGGVKWSSLTILLTEVKGQHKSTFAIGGVQCFSDSIVVTESSVLRINICAQIQPIANLQNISSRT